MSWIMYKTVFRITSPIHIGWDKFSILHKTRPYITGRSFWGAITASLAAYCYNGNYRDVGKEVDVQLRFSYFYPSTCKDRVSLFPWDDEEKFYWLYINGHVSTALDMHLAEDASLHEIEYISPITRDGNQVYVVGYIFENAGNELKWREALNKVRFGGERSYGWGNVELADEPYKENSFFGRDIELSGDNPQLKLLPNKEKNDHLLAHALAACETECKGVLEPLIGRETLSRDGFGTFLSKPIICWMPGSKMKKEILYTIISKGIWEPIS